MTRCQFCGASCQVTRTGAYAHCSRQSCTQEAEANHRNRQTRILDRDLPRRFWRFSRDY